MYFQVSRVLRVDYGLQEGTFFRAPRKNTKRRTKNLRHGFQAKFSRALSNEPSLATIGQPQRKWKWKKVLRFPRRPLSTPHFLCGVQQASFQKLTILKFSRQFSLESLSWQVLDSQPYFSVAPIRSPTCKAPVQTGFVEHYVGEVFARQK